MRPGRTRLSNRQRKAQRLRANVAVWLGVLAVVSMMSCSGAGSDGDENAEKPVSQKTDRVADDAKKKDPTQKQERDLVVCRIYTPEPGFFVLVDGEPARDAKDEWLKTPCQVRVLPGSRQITVAKEGYRDTHEQVNVSRETRVVFSSVPKAGLNETSILEAAFIDAAPAEPIPLVTLNSEDRELDPFISPDGTLLYFVSDRNGIKGIYYTDRKSAYSYFENKPKLVPNSRGYNLPASPSLTEDSLSILYTNPKLGTIFALSRETPRDDFSTNQDLKKRSVSRGEWLSARAIRDGNRAWWLYWLERDGDQYRAYASSSRRRVDSADDVRSRFGTETTDGKRLLAPLAGQVFREQSRIDLKGTHPCLSQDGLRHYTFDGKLLRKATRSDFSQPFSGFKIISNLDLDDADYQPAPNRRAFSITDDEQWLFFESKGDLFMVRVFRGKGRGFVTRGKAISPLPAKIVKRRKPDPETSVAKNTVPKKKPVDPRTVPLPYPRYREELAKKLQSRDYAGARMLVEEKRKDKELARDRNLLQWDREEIARIEAFWKDVRDALAGLKPGTVLRIGRSRRRFVRFAGNTLVVKSQTKTFTRDIRKMNRIDLIAFVDGKFGRKDSLRQLRAGTFRFHDAERSLNAATGRFNRAGDAGRQFLERLAQRELQQARHEFDRGNLGAGLIRVQRVLSDFPKSKAAPSARKMNEEAYLRTKWVKQGRRIWREADGAFSADAGKSAGSLLRSPKQYENFELRLQWKSDVPQGQGGVYFRYTGSGDRTETAFKIQLSDDRGISADKFCTGSLFKIEAPTQNAVRKQGEWNTLNLRVEGESVRVTINGRTVLETTAKSETIPRKGYIALDGVLGGITYRRALLIELPKSR